MTHILILKTAALGDVLRTTSILPGLHERYDEARITWVTARSAVDLLRTHPLIRTVVEVDVDSGESANSVIGQLSTTGWARIISLDDEFQVARIAAELPSRRVSGAYVRRDGGVGYTPDTASWFDMGLVSVHGKTAADALKIRNRRSQPEIYADMLGLRMGKPALHLPEESQAFARAFAERTGLLKLRPLLGLNTGAGGRWVSKQLDVDRTVATAKGIHAARGGQVSFLVLGGESEAERNAAIVAGLAREGLVHFDGGTRNPLLDFAALVGSCDALLASDSLALHVGVALSVRVVAFFAPTSAAEIELYGRGEKVESTSPDSGSYRPEADNSTLTPQRLVAAVLPQLAAAERERGPSSDG